MRTTSLIVILGCCISGFAQRGTIMSGSAGKDNRVSFTFETRLEPPSPPGATRNIGGGVSTSKTGFHRYMKDAQEKKYFGYDLLIEPLEGPNTFQVTFLPLSVGPEKLDLHYPASWSSLPLPRYPPPQIVRGGDTVVLDLLVNPTTGQKIVDYLVIGGEPDRRYSASGPAHDFTVEDAVLRIVKPQLRVNGKLVEASAQWGGSVTGAVTWFYLADQGRFLFSLVPREELGFRKAGEIRGSTLSFTWGSDTYGMNCKGRIAPGFAAYNLYVLQDLTYRPKGTFSGAPFMLGAGGDGSKLDLRQP